ncbi:MAG: OB-fold domain-containing protein [Chloroflexota bacterium]
MAYDKPLPTPDPVTKPFWDSVKAHRMMLQKGSKSGKFVFYPRAISPYDPDEELVWTPVSGRGVVHAFTIPHRHPVQAFTKDGPYVVALIELEEGAKMLTNLVGVAANPDAVKVGMAVEVAYDDVTDELTLPKFKPR